eukprot:GGOE01025280.1.p1 GENE.GGOE01025280.1~~GGOE01025280.1.p1  ORF type:complete len:834 (-),score=299.97 GGOE01025280.1:282-2537(-)
MNALRSVGKRGTALDEQASITENLSILRLKRVPLWEKRDELQNAVRVAGAKAVDDKLKADRIRTKLPLLDCTQGEVMTIAEMGKSMKKLNDRIAKAEKNPAQISLVEHLKSQKKQYEKCQPSLVDYWHLIETSFDAKAKEQAIQQELDQVLKELETVEKEFKALSSKQKPLDDAQEREEKAERQEKSDKLWADVQQIQKEIEKLKKDKQQLRDNFKATEGSKQPLNDELKDTIAQRDAIFEKLKEVRAGIPVRTVPYNKAYHSDLIGSKGATVQGLQEEFGVVLNVSPEKGEVQIKGAEDDITACEQAIAELLKNAEDSRCSATMRYDVGVSRELIGTGGSNIQKIQEASGARINVESKTGTITITGPQAAVDLAKQILEEFFSATCRVMLKFKPDIGDVVVGRGGKTVRRVQEETGVKSINIKKESGTIEIIGSKDSVQEAKKMYEELIQSFQSGGVEMKLAPDMVGAIVGKGGANIMKIQDDTGCIVTVNRAPTSGGRGMKGGYAAVNIKGPSAGVTAARAMIEEMLHSNGRDAEKVPFDPHLRLFLIRPPKDDPNGLCPLEKIRRESGCLRVEAVRGENFVAVTGRRECTATAVQLLKDLLLANAMEVVKVDYPPVLFGVIGVREEGRDSVMDGVRKEFGCESVMADKAGVISIVGEAAAAAAAAAKVKEMVNTMRADIESITVPSERAMPIIIGSGGQNINRLRRETNTEINLDRATMTASLYGPAAGRAKALEALTKIFAEVKVRE